MNRTILSALVTTVLVGISTSAAAQAVNPFSPPPPPPPPVVEMPIQPVAPTPEPEPEPEPEPMLLEQVQASRIGVVNGKFFYRGSDTYLFDEMGERKLVRQIAEPSLSEDEPASRSPAARSPRSSASSAAPAPKPLPSMVGRPAPARN